MPEFWNKTEQCGRETVAFWKRFLPLMTVGRTTPDQHATDLLLLKTLAQTREDRLAGARTMKKRELAQFNLIRTLNLAMPMLIAGRFDERNPVRRLLADAFAVVPYSDELNLKRARVLIPIWKKANAALAARKPGDAVVREEIGVAEFASLVTAYPALRQASADAEAKVAAARGALRTFDRKVDRLNKRAYKIFRVEVSTNETLRESLKTAITREPTSGSRRVA